MDQLDIEIFLAIAKSQSISKASKSLLMSQPAVSQRLKSLEDELQVNLVLRKKGGRTIEITDAGIRFANMGEKWLELYHEMVNLKNAEPARQLTIASTNSLNNYLFLPLFNEISKCDKRLRLFIRTQHTLEIFELVDSKKADIGFVFHDAKYKDIVSKAVFREKFYMICGKNSAWKERLVEPSWLDPRDELRISWCPSVEQWRDLWWNPAVKPYIQLDSPYLFLNFMDREGRWAICPESVLRTFHFEDQVEVHEFTDPPPERECFMISHKYPSESQAKAISIFESYLRVFAQKLPFSVYL